MEATGSDPLARGNTGRRKDANLHHSPSKNENFQKYALDTANAHTNLS